MKIELKEQTQKKSNYQVMDCLEEFTQKIRSKKTSL